MSAPVCVISGVGPGTGSALARRFTEGGYRVALLARNESRLAALERELANAKGFPCDVSDPEQVESAATTIERDLGHPSVLIHNAVGAGHGAIVATGNTSALRGKPSFAGFAPTKAAQRILAEAMARELGPLGVPVASLL